eukprot:CAMPEP_0172386754 /NCGR_PEP_ID=MMETSP1061-20121228/4212_1 /TAXON_ID=37318 /ORGANISM="Pseudo-nitzschia pungens, Strain cf. pungens" /LENGTH=725 /DNA_ID=CAMNT_0013116215 /DNA_START=318 /DNA_END=2498 /DNA_ORIENTATION=+
MTGASQTTGSDSPAVTTGTSAVPNWRLIPKEADDYKAHLVDRPSWSENQYRESLELYEQLTSCSDSYVSPGIQSALETLDHAYRLYGPESVICSFNGGKDAVVILHLVRAVHAKYYNATGTTPIRPRAVYFNNHDEFSEVTAFLEDSVSTYDLDMVAFEHGVGFAAGLNILVEHNFVGGSTTTNTNRLTLPMAFVLGTRDSDPNAAGQDRFCPSSDWMPPFMRVNPVLEWNYGLVWHFLRLFKLPYCSLYDQGYTSLGTTKDTLPCPALVVHPEEVHNNNSSSNNDVDNTNTNNNNNNAGKAPGDAGSLPKFWPAYMLVDWDQERAGRVKKPKPGPKKADKSSDSSSETRPTSAASSTDAAVDATNAKVTQAAAAADNSSNDNDNDNKNENENGDDDEKDASEYGGATKTVGMLVVGDEILKGMTTDTNTQTAARALRKECLTLSRVVVVSDDVAEIATEINRLRSSVDVVITSGGVGPTHDDVTIKGVAEALGSELVYNEDMGTLLKEKLNNNNGDGNGNGNGDSESNNNKNKNNELTSAQLKMATLPPSAKLRYLSTDEWPVLQCRNIFVLPGVPEFFSKKIENVAAYLSSQLERSVVYKIVLSVDEPSIVDVLNRAVEKHSRVSIGSYPFVSHPEFKTVVTLEADLVDSSYMSSIANEVRYAPASALSSSSRNSLFLGRDVVLLSKEDRDRNARMALDELISELPEGSILRVENDDIMDPLM